MKRLFLLLTITLLVFACSAPKRTATTFCNSLNLSYRYQLDEPSRREAADPVIVLFQNRYFLFASKSGGYWVSENLVDWQLIEPTGLPLEDYAPAVVEIDGKLYFTAFNSGAIYSTNNPRKGDWTKIADIPQYADPALYLDDDGRLFMYHGCSNDGPIHVQELDPSTFAPIGEGSECFRGDYANRGWEVFGDDNLGGDVSGAVQYSPWIEGAWMNKVNGLYYLQYAAPGTQWKSYADGVYTAASPRGPFTYAPYSPFAHKPTGFITGAGHGNTFQDKNGRYWHIGTMVISVHHMFERRLGLFPVGFDADGQIYTNTYLADYPQKTPGSVAHPEKDNLAGWMLLSHDKQVSVSSELTAHPAGNAVDEEVRSWWSAETGDAGEWLAIDLGEPCDVMAVQVNFADHGTNAFGREEQHFHQYRMSASLDGRQWQMIIDKSADKKDVPHDYSELSRPVTAQHVKIENVHMPARGTFAISDFRIFGHAPGLAPGAVLESSARRDPFDPRRVQIDWRIAAGAAGYVVRYGVAPDKLYNNYQLYGATQVSINSLNVDVDYYYVVDAFNGAGITRGEKVFSMQ